MTENMPPLIDPISNSTRFVSKFDSNGRALWARRITINSVSSNSFVTTDSSENVIMTSANGSSSLVPNILTIFNQDNTIFTTFSNTSQTSPLNADAFIVKYNSGGTPLWARKVGGANNDRASSVITDSSENVILVGEYASSAFNAPLEMTIWNADQTSVFTKLSNTSSSGTSDAFIVKYNSVGTPLWARRFGGSNSEGPRTVTTDSSQNIIIGGTYNGSMNVYGTNNTTIFTTLSNSAPTSNFDAFILKYDSNGTPLWARRLGGTLNENVSSIVIDSSQNIIALGTYSSTTFNIFNTNNTTVLTTLSNSGSQDIFIVKYDSNGTFLWARRIGGSTSNFQSVGSVSVDSSQNIVVGGSYNSASLRVFNADQTTFLTTILKINAVGINESFIVKYDSNGTPLWVKGFSGNISNANLIYWVTVDSSKNIIATGSNGNGFEIY
jgi:hypothetical protein